MVYYDNSKSEYKRSRGRHIKRVREQNLFVYKKQNKMSFRC